MQAVEAPSASPRWLPDVLGLAWVLLVGVSVLMPALVHGASLGPYDELARYGLTANPSITPYNLQRGDLIAEMIPWASQSWHQVHHGHLPLWSSQNGLGMPLAFNWQSAVASLPAMLGYLAPARLAFTVQVVVTTMLAGSGAYVACRVLRLRVLAAALGGTAFVLSGAFFVLVGWPAAGVMAWSGWLVALAVLVLRGEHVVRWSLLLALAWALCLLAGQPDTLAAVSLSAGAALLVGLVLVARRRGWRALPGRGLLGLAGAGVLGAGLAAPILLPALQLTGVAIRSVGTPDRALSPHLMLNLLFVGYDGLPFAGTTFFGTMFIGSAMWVGPVVVALALVAVVRRWRQPHVLVLSVVVVLDLVVVFVPAVISVLNGLPVAGSVMWRWSLMALMLALALLAATGLDEILGSFAERATRVTAWASTATVAAVVGLVWLLGRSGLTSEQAATRVHSFVWPLLGLAALVITLAGLELARSRSAPGAGRILVGGLLVAQAALLVSAGAPLWRSELTHPPHPPAVTALGRIVGTSTVAFGAKSCFIPPTLGIQEQANILYGIHEFDAYDPMTPTTLFDAWALVSGGTSPGTYVPPSQFCPAVTDGRIARRFGIRFLLVAHGAPAPFGTERVATVGDEDLYRVPSAAPAILVGRGAAHGPDALGHPLGLRRTTPSSAVVSLDAPRPSVVRLHLQRVPGWTATIDGRPLRLRSYSVAMMQADVPAGHHVIRLRYLPGLFVVGLWVAAGSAVAMGALTLLALRRRRATSTSSEAGQG